MFAPIETRRISKKRRKIRNRSNLTLENGDAGDEEGSPPGGHQWHACCDLCLCGCGFGSKGKRRSCAVTRAKPRADVILRLSWADIFIAREGSLMSLLSHEKINLIYGKRKAISDIEEPHVV
jgi:hypothetical protein